MNASKRIIANLAAGSIIAASCFGCQNMNNTQKGAAVGAAGGAGLGAIVGKQLGNTGMGALVGGLAGTATGAMVGNAKDEADRRDAYAQQAVYERNLRYRQQKAMSNGDVINMVANGASDPLIISTMRSRGGNFDVSPQSVIFLHNNGVSDNVIQAMQGSSY